LSPRVDPATAAELSRIGLFGSLPGEVLNRIAGELTREDVGPGQTIDTVDRFVVLLRGMASGPGGMLRPGASVGPGGGTLRSISPVTVVSCDRATYDEHIRPHTGGA
jgi:hypothetical protein